METENNAEVTSADTAVEDVVGHKQNNVGVIVIVFCAVVLVCITLFAWFFARSGLVESEGEMRDSEFSAGFFDTGYEWSDNMSAPVAELNRNPLCEIRASYCSNVGYKYADFGCDCFVNQYYDSYKTYIDLEESFKVYYFDKWTENKKSVFDALVQNTRFELKRDGTSCRIRYGVISEEDTVIATTTNKSYARWVAPTLDITSVSERRVYFNQSVTDEARAFGFTEYDKIIVPNFPYQKSDFGFVLDSTSDEPLPEACIEEFEVMLRSQSIIYPRGSITDTSNGIISLEEVDSSFEVFAGISRPVQFVFKNADTGREEVVASSGLEDWFSVYQPFFSNNKLFLRNTSADSSDPVITIIDLFTEEKEQIRPPVSEGGTIHSVFVKSKVMYYLEGQTCGGYLQSCSNMNLRSYNLETKEQIRYTTESHARSIQGLDDAGNVVLVWGDADAGCFWSKYEKYDIATQTLIDLEEISACSDDKDYAEVQAKIADLTSGSRYVPYLIVKNGKLFLPTTEMSDRVQWTQRLRVNSDEYQVISD